MKVVLYHGEAMDVHAFDTDRCDLEVWIEDDHLCVRQNGPSVRFVSQPPTTNSAMDAICAFAGKCQYQNIGAVMTCTLPGCINGCPHRRHQ